MRNNTFKIHIGGVCKSVTTINKDLLASHYIEIIEDAFYK